MKDKALKERLLKHYWSQRCFVQAEVDVSYAGGLDGVPKLVTDVDVYALRPHPSLRFERVLGDCRTLRGQSPISRVLWLRGLMTFTRASSGCVLLSDRRIETDHKLAANHVDVLLTTAADFEVYDRSLVPPEGSEKTNITIDEMAGLRAIGKQFSHLEPLVKQVYQHAWQEQDFGSLIRHTIGELRIAARELDPSRADHRGLVVDAAATLAVGVAECAGCVFRQYLQPDAKAQLSDALKALIWGGYEDYSFIQKLRRRLAEATRNEASSGELELPEWNTFVQMIRNILESPLSVFTSPWVLKKLAVDVYHDRRPVVQEFRGDLLSIKFAMLILEYACKASGIPRDFAQRLVSVTVGLQSDLVMASQNGAGKISAPTSGRSDAGADQLFSK